MLGHASRRAEHNLFASVLLVAAGRAWTRTRPPPSRTLRRMSDHKSSHKGSGVLHYGETSTSKLLSHNLGQRCVLLLSSWTLSALIQHLALLTRRYLCPNTMHSLVISVFPTSPVLALLSLTELLSLIALPVGMILRVHPPLV
jgi:hypothetical protein